MNQAARELKLSEVVRALPTNHRAYKEYSELVGKAEMLKELEGTLREFTANLNQNGVRQAPEIALMNELTIVTQRLKAIIEASNPRPTEHRLGLE